MNALYLIVGLVALQRLCELLYAERNTHLLKQRGATEIDHQHYPLFILLHGAWLLTLVTLAPAHYPVRRSLLVLFIGILESLIPATSAKNGRPLHRSGSGSLPPDARFLSSTAAFQFKR
ncbi:MAG TPA: hypothetical protein VF930_00975 [Stellaceae bacterium]